MLVLQAPAAEALDQTSLEGLSKRLDSLETAAKDKLVEQVSPNFTLYSMSSTSALPTGDPNVVPYSSRDHWLQECQPLL